MENIPLGAINPRRWLVLTVVVAARQREIKRGRQGSKEGRRLPNADLQHSHKKLLMGKFAADSEPSASIDARGFPVGCANSSYRRSSSEPLRVFANMAARSTRAARSSITESSNPCATER